jgi:osmoprotectant transport system ATP-binding protein
LTTPAIDFRNVSFALPGGHLLLDRISLTLDEGTTTAILGRSGSGKTTLLRTVNRLLEPTSGEVFLTGLNARDRDLIALRRSIGYVIQEVGLFPHFNLERNVAFVLEAEGVSLDKRIRRSHELLAEVGLDPARPPLSPPAFRWPAPARRSRPRSRRRSAHPPHGRTLRRA